MEKSASEYITIKLKFPYKHPINCLGYNGLLPLLTFLENSIFPKPLQMEFSGKSRNRDRKKSIKSYLDPKLLAVIEPDGAIGTYIGLNAVHDPNTFFKVYIFQGSNSDSLVINIGLKLMDKMGTGALKHFFLTLLEMFPQVHFAQCSFSSYWIPFTDKHMSGGGKYRTNYFPFLVWLQYLNEAELVIHGGINAFETNPILNSQRLNNGLLVEVGNSPDDIFTEEGELLLVKATFSLPPVQSPSKV